MLFDALPIWSVFFGTIVLLSLVLEAGFRFGQARLQRAGKVDGAGAMIGATMGLLAFMLAFTFNAAAGRHEARKMLVIEEANAIQQTSLRAGFLPEPDRQAVRSLLRDYVDVRIKVAGVEMALDEGLRRTDELKAKIWEVAEKAARTDPASIPTGLFVQSLGSMFDLHSKRLAVGARMRIPETIWLALYVLAIAAMFMMGVQTGLTGTRHAAIQVGLAVAFGIVLFLIADLDRPQDGLVNVSQQALIELRDALNPR